MRIAPADHGDPRIAGALATHFGVTSVAPPPGDSCHALAVAGIRTGRLDLWAAWDADDTLLGIGGLLEIDAHHGEVTSLHTVEPFRRRGTGRAILRHLVEEARRRGYDRLILETGSSDDVAPARRLFDATGFAECEPFGDYGLDPGSVYMMLRLR